MRKTSTGFPLVPIALGVMLAFLTDKKESAEAKAWTGQQLNTATTPLKKYFTELMETFDNTFELLKKDTTACRSGESEDYDKNLSVYHTTSPERNHYKGYYGI